MKDYSNKYKHYYCTDKNGRQVVISVSTYEGRNVKGYAKCDVNDSYDIEAGKRLADARCNERIARKRANRSIRKLQEAQDQLALAQIRLDKMVRYFEDSHDALASAEAAVDEILETL